MNFVALYRIRLRDLWVKLFLGWVALFAALIISAIIVFFTAGGTGAEILKLVIGGFVGSALWLAELICLVEAFRCSRRVFNLGMQNGYSRRLTFWTQISVFVSTQIALVLIVYPLFVSILPTSAFRHALLQPQAFLMVFLISLVFIFSAFELSSFITLFEPKIWWLIIFLMIVLSQLNDHYIMPVVQRLLPSWLLGTLNYSIGSVKEISTVQPEFWISICCSLVISLVIARLCYHFMQTRRFNIFGKRQVNKVPVNQ